ARGAASLRAGGEPHRSVSRGGRAAAAPVRCARLMTDRLAGTRVSITGAACARRMAAEGASLLLADLDGDATASLARELNQHAVQVDVTRLADIQRMV